MAAVTSLLVLACAWAAAVAYPLGANQCRPIQTGFEIGNGIPLAKTTLQPGIADFEVLIPDIPNCPKGPIGVKALMCDFDVVPSASFITTNIISVHRVGSLAGEGSVTPTVYCGNELQNNQQLLQNNQLWLSKNQLQNDVHSHLWGQIPQSVHGQSYLLPSLGPISQSLLGQTHSPLLGQSQLSLLSGQAPQSVYGQSSLLSLNITPLSQMDHTHNPLLSSLPTLGLSHLPQMDHTQNLLGQSQNSVWGQSPQSVYGQSSLPTLGLRPMSEMDHKHNLLGQSQNSVWGQSPQSVYGQSSLPTLGLSPLSQMDHRHNLLGQSQNSVSGQSPQFVYGQSSLPSLDLSPLSQLDHTHNPLLWQSSLPLLGQSPLLTGQSSQPEMGHLSLLMGQSSLPLLQLGQTRQLISGESSLPQLGLSPLVISQSSLPQSPLLMGRSSQPLLENSPQKFIAQAY